MHCVVEITWSSACLANFTRPGGLGGGDIRKGIEEGHYHQDKDELKAKEAAMDSKQ